MTRMDCDEVRDVVAAYADDQLPPAERRAVADHLSTCPACTASLADLEQLRATVRRAGTYDMPDGLETRLRAALGVEATASDAANARRRWAALAASHLLVAALAATLAVVLWDRAATRDQGLDEMVSAHVRATLAGAPVEIASADTHTVRPWFTSRLSFAPPVRELAGDGFPLVGGRLDHVLGQTAAGLVYMRRKHRINVLVVPAEAARARGFALEAPLGTAVPARAGYNIATWMDQSFAYFAVSDLNAGELADFARAFRAAGT